MAQGTGRRRGPQRGPGVSVEAWFREHVVVTERCHLFTGFVDRRSGYGSLYVPPRRVLAHRYAWELAHGPIPPGLKVLHHCDNPRCVNAYGCLFLGTQAENLADMAAKGRGGPPPLCGARNPHAKLTAEQVAEIRSEELAEIPHKELAAKYGVGALAIYRVRRGATW